MKKLLSKRLILAVTVVFFTILCSFSAQATEKKKVTFTKKMKQLISRADVYIGDVPKHRITQWVRTDSHTYSDPDFGSAEEWIYMHSDSVAGSGTHRGHSVTIYENGEKSYWKWEGTHKLTVKEGGAWESNFEGKMQVTGGTGKFKNIKGEGVYKGTMTAKGLTGSGEFEVEY